MKSYPKLCTFLWNFSMSSPTPEKKSFFLFLIGLKVSLGPILTNLTYYFKYWPGGNYLPLECENVPLTQLSWTRILTPEPEVVSLSFMNLRGEETFASTTQFHSRNPTLVKKGWGLSAHDLWIFQKWECSQKKRKRQFPPLWAKEEAVNTRGR